VASKKEMIGELNDALASEYSSMISITKYPITKYPVDPSSAKASEYEVLQRIGYEKTKHADALKKVISELGGRLTANAGKAKKGIKTMPKTTLKTSYRDELKAALRYRELLRKVDGDSKFRDNLALKNNLYHIARDKMRHASELRKLI